MANNVGSSDEGQKTPGDGSRMQSRENPLTFRTVKDPAEGEVHAVVWPRGRYMLRPREITLFLFQQEGFFKNPLKA